jgi:hypothetical protein
MRRVAIGQLQRSHGNAFVGRLLARERAEAIHRQPEGAPPTHDPAGSASAPATLGLDADMPSTSPASRTAMDLAMAQALLTQSYGAIKEIVAGKIVLLADREATWKRCDKIHKGHANPSNANQPWTDGDAEKYHPGLDGFAWEGTVYVNRQSQLATVTAHEVLHLNAAAGFGAAVGDAIQEGLTEYLARKAFTDAGIELGRTTAYADEVVFVTKLTLLVDEQTLIDAYFTGADVLIEKFDALKGSGAFAELRSVTQPPPDWIEAEMMIQPGPRP